MAVPLSLTSYIASWQNSPLGGDHPLPWEVTAQAPERIRRAFARLGDGWRRQGDIAVHRTATIETGAVLKGPLIIGAQAFVAAGAYLRGGVYLDRGCVIGPNAEVKTSFLFAGAKVAHLSFVGDSLLGADVNIEAGAVIANHRNERAEKAIRIVVAGRIIDTGVEKFGTLAGDGVRIGANAVIAPGAVLLPGTCIGRLHLHDQSPEAEDPI